MSLVGRLFLLVLLSAAPVLVGQLFTQAELRQEREAAARAEAARYARLVSSDAESIVEEMKGILIAVSQAPVIRRLDLPLCNAFLANLATRYSEILNITLIDAGGRPVCANTAIAADATASDRFYFTEAMRLDAFVIGSYILGRTISAPQLPVALPFADDAGHRFVLSLGIRLDWLQRQFAGLALPPGAAIWIADKDGVVFVAPSASGLVGQKLPPDLLAAALGPAETTFERRDREGNPHLVSLTPLAAPPVGLEVIVDLPQRDVFPVAAAAAWRDVAVLIVSILGALAIATIGARTLVSRPLRALAVATESWAAGRFGVRANLADKSSEIGQLGTAFDHMAGVVESSHQALQAANETLERRVEERTAALSAANRQLESEMAERQAAEAALRQAQKMDAIGQLVGGIAHDFNNMLTAIGGSIRMLAKAVPDSDDRARRFGTLGLQAVDRAARMTHRLLAFARQQPLEMQTVDLNRLVAGMSELLQRTLGETIEIETVLAGGLWMTRSDPGQLENALLNLAINARDAMPAGGKLTVETGNVALDAAYARLHAEVTPGQYVMLAVSDTGTGMSAETMARVFDPFFTTKPAGRGTGLGLSMIYGFAKQSRGHITIYSELGFGTTIKLYLPRSFSPADAGAPLAMPAPLAVAAGGGETVLVVEDEDAVREVSAAFLREQGYAVLAAAHAGQALEMLRKNSDVAVLFTDVVLTGGVNGRELAEQALRERPELRVLFTTGYTANAIIHGGVLDPGVHLLAKPFTAEAVGMAIRELLERRGDAV